MNDGFANERRVRRLLDEANGIATQMHAASMAKMQAIG
jgi:hypothetical protein